MESAKTVRCTKGPHPIKVHASFHLVLRIKSFYKMAHANTASPFQKPQKMALAASVAHVAKTKY